MIEDILPRYQEVATGNKTAFTVPFETINSSYINVYLNKVKQTTGYTVSGKTITFGTAPASGTLVTVVRVIPISWEHTVLGAIDQNSLNKIFTDIIAKMQTLEEGLNRAIKTDVTDTESGSDYFLSLLADAMDSLAQAQTKLTQVQSAATQALSDISTAKTTAISDFNTNASTKTTDFNTNAATKQALVDAAAEAAEESAELAEQYAESINPENFDTVKGKISNCILEIPQNISISASGTSITLKGGSVCAMTGSSAYITTTIASDITRDFSNWDNGTYYLIYTGSQITLYDKNRVQSGSSLPENPAVNDRFYLATDYSYYYGNTSNVWAKTTGSYPLAIVIRDSEGFHFAKDSKGRDMIFNGAGYIGHHAFVYPNVKGLISQEKETDGRLKSINQKLSGLYITELSTTNNVLMINSYSARFAHENYGGEVDSMDKLPNLTPLYYVKNRNRMVKGSNKNTYNGVILADCIYNGTTVTDFTIRQPVRLATTEMLDKKQDTLTFDTTPTQSSTNPVTSGGVYTALGTKQDTLVSGNNIKTINSTSVLGSGNFTLADQSLSNLDSTGQMVVDSQNGTISNCILEIPQNIKVTLENNVLTAKSGSILTDSGSVYQTITLTEDKTIQISNTANLKRVIFATSSGTLSQVMASGCVSGNTDSKASEAFHIWFDTSNKEVNYYGSDGTTASHRTYPLCIVETDSSGVASFAKDSHGNDMIFNGVGYIGHHAFVYPNVKALLPNGFNADGSLSSTINASNALSILEMSSSNNSIMKNIYGSFYINRSGEDLNSTDEIQDTNTWHYIKSLNGFYRITTGLQTSKLCLFIKCRITGTTVTDFTIRQPYEGARNLLTDDIEEEIATKANDSEVVKLTGDQTIAGSKTYSSGINVLGDSIAPYSLRRTGITKGTAPSSTVESRWRVTESGGVTNSYSLGGMMVSYKSDGKISTSLQAFKPEAGSTVLAEFGIVYPASGAPYTFAPTPAVGDNSTKIATTAYVNSKFQVVSSLPASPDANTFYFVTGA